MKHFSHSLDTEPEERMRSVIDHVVDGIITINAQGIVTTFNSAAERNAAKYTRSPSRIRLTLRREGGEAIVSVADPGQGIAPELLTRVFDLFVQGDNALARSQGGLGIGLTLVRRLVEMHDGTVSAKSEGPGLGSQFTVRLPVLPEPGERAAAQGPTRGAVAAGPSRRVLVVDDNLDAAESIRKILDLYGHQVRAVYDGHSALAMAEDFRPEIVVLDIGLPGMDGYEVARRLRSMSVASHARIVAVTGYGQEEDRVRSREAGFDQHMTKPVDPDALNSFVTGAEPIEKSWRSGRDSNPRPPA